MPPLSDYKDAMVMLLCVFLVGYNQSTNKEFLNPEEKMAVQILGARSANPGFHAVFFPHVVFFYMTQDGLS